MTEWVDKILTPHVLKCREDTGNPNSVVVLLMDGLNTHFHESILPKFEELSPIILIDLLPHSSHFTQPCDGPFFASVKQRYVAVNVTSYENNFVMKLLRIKKTIQ